MAAEHSSPPTAAGATQPPPPPDHSVQEGYQGGLGLMQATCKKFYEYCSEHGIALPRHNFRLKYDTNIPRQVCVECFPVGETAEFVGRRGPDNFPCPWSRWDSPEARPSAPPSCSASWPSSACRTMTFPSKSRCERVQQEGALSLPLRSWAVSSQLVCPLYMRSSARCSAPSPPPPLLHPPFSAELCPVCGDTRARHQRRSAGPRHSGVRRSRLYGLFQGAHDPRLRRIRAAVHGQCTREAVGGGARQGTVEGRKGTFTFCMRSSPW